MERAQKPKHIQEVKEMVERSSSVVLAHQKGLTVAESNAIRGEMRSKNGSFKVVKNRLMGRALKDKPYNLLLEFFKGPVVIFSSPDPVEAAKVSVKAEKELGGKITVIAALADGKLMEISEVKSLAALPSLEAIRGGIVALLAAAAVKLAVLAAEPAGMLARLLRAGAEGREEPPPTAAEPAPPPLNESNSDEKSGKEAAAEKAEATEADESSAPSKPESQE